MPLIANLWKHRRRVPEGLCEWCQHDEHEPTKCRNCNCGESDRTHRLFGVSIETDNWRSYGKRSRMNYKPD